MSAEIALGKHPPAIFHLMQFRGIGIRWRRFIRLLFSETDHAGRRCVPPIDGAKQTGACAQQDKIERRIEVPQPRFSLRQTVGQVVLRRNGGLQ